MHRCRRAAALFAGALALWLSPDLPRAAPGSGYLDRPLVEVLLEFREQGHELIFSSAVVTEELRVTIEPSSTTVRKILDEILTPLGLQATDGPKGTILIVHSTIGKLKGRVVTAVRGDPVTGAEVRLSGTGSSVTTADDGSFEIEEVPAGLRELVVEATGYLPATRRVRVNADEAARLTIRLETRSWFVTEVVVTPNRHSLVLQEQAPSRRLTSEDAVLAPSSGGDATRVIELLPGVAAADASAAFNVRGSKTEDVSLVLDGLELYDPFHLQAFQSPFSLVDSNVVDRIDFFGGGYTADLGDRHGGFVKISTIAPTDPASTQIELGTLNSRASYRAPIGDGSGAWLIAVRGWYPEAFQDSIQLGFGESLDPRFGDLYAKAAFKLSPITLFSVHALMAYDRLNFTETNEDVNESVDALTRNSYVWLRALQARDNGVASETVLSFGRLDSNRDGISAPDDRTVSVEDDRRVGFVGLRHDSSWRISDAHLFKAGIDVRRLEAEYEYSNVVEQLPKESMIHRLSSDGTSLAAYTSYRVRLTPRLATEIGIRWDRQSYTNDNQLGPRFNLVWRPVQRSEFRLAVGRFNQSQRIHELKVEDGETSYGRAEVSEQIELTFQQRFGVNTTLRVDAYYRELSDLRPRYENLLEPVEFFPETTEDRIALEPSTARLRGVEILLRGDTTRPLVWWASYTISSAEDFVEGSYQPRSWDQSHAGKFLIGYRKGDRWSVSLSGSSHTGWPTTPATPGVPEVDDDGQLRYTVVLGERNSARFSTYTRFDFNGRRSFSVPGGRLSLTMELLNIFDRRNECCVDEFAFEPLAGGGVSNDTLFEHWLGATGAFSVLWEF